MNEHIKGLFLNETEWCVAFYLPHAGNTNKNTECLRSDEQSSWDI